MEITGQPEHRGIPQSFTIPRGFLIFMIIASGWSLYSMLRHVSARFEVPQHFVTSFDLFGRAGVAIDLCIYLYVVWLGFLFVRLARDWLERVWVACWIAPIVINPFKMLIPRYSYLVWWAELFLALVFFLATIALFLNWKPSQTLARCRARFSTATEPRAPER
jgi:hypothetical protein